MMLMLSGSLMPHMLSVVLTLVWMLAWFDLFGRRHPAPAAIPRMMRIATAGSPWVCSCHLPLTALAVGLPFAFTE
jgi:hypothetical protein